MAGSESFPFGDPGDQAGLPKKDTPLILVTGMEIPRSPVRDRLQALRREVEQALSTARWIEHLEGTVQFYDQMAQVEGITVVERRNPAQDELYKCAEYVFNMRNGETWTTQKFEGDGREFWLDNHAFLINHGYEVVEHPQVGDTIAYGSWDPRIQKGAYPHFGIYEGDGQVISKWDRGHIFRHPWDLVPTKFGPHVAFFRKSA